MFPGHLQAQTVATPTVNPGAGTYTTSQTVTVSSGTSGATIYYTTNGSTPTTSSSSVASGGTVLISQSETLKAMATASGYTNSAVASATYQITGQVAAGEYHTLALKTNGSVWAWGYNNYGEVGDGTSTQRVSAVQVENSNGTNFTGVVEVAAGAYHSLALKNDGTVWGWGLNSSNQLGDGTTTERNCPVEVQKSNGSGGTTPLTNIVAICSGDYHNLALDSSGNVWAWGRNNNGELGDGGTTQQSVAEELTTLSGVSVQEIVAGGAHSLLLTTGGAVMSWGLNTGGQLGQGNTTQYNSPTVVSALSGYTITALAAGDTQTVALQSNGTVWVWGANVSGEVGVGDGTTTQRNSPVHLTSLSNVTAVEAGRTHILAISNGTVWSWGTNAAGELGDGTSIVRNSPVQALNITGAIFATAGNEDSLVLKNDGTLWVSGANNCGQLGDGVSVLNDNALQILGLTSSIKQIATGCTADHVLALDNSNNVWAWGNNANGQLGDGTNYQRVNPVHVSFSGLGSAAITSLAANGNRSLVLDSNGTVWSWGINPIGNGTTTDASQPTHLSGLSSITAVAEGPDGMALDSSGHVWTWGANNYGQIGDGTTTQRTSPVEVKNYSGGSGTYLSNVTAISGGDEHALALSGGAVYAWGDNAYGELGDGTTTNRSLPVPVTGLSGLTIVAISGGVGFSAAVDSNGHVWTWGNNANAELGNGNTTQQTTPVEVLIWGNTPLSNVVAVHCGEIFCTALKSDGTVWAWGWNSKGEFCDGAFTTGYVAVPAVNLSGINAITSGYLFSVAVRQDGSLQSWGYDGNGAVGAQANYASPFAIPGFDAVASLPAPTVSITAPGSSTTLLMGQTQTFTASASETGGTIASVSYYINSTLIGTSTTGSTYSVTWTPPTWGNFTFTAIATDTNGHTSYNSAPVTVTIEPIAAAPTATPGSSQFTAAQNVTVSSATSGATIYYTLDGSTPTTGSASVASGGTISITQSSTVLGMFAAAGGYGNSAVATYVYLIVPPPTAPSNLVATAVPDGVDLSWTDNGSSATSITVQQSTDGGTTWTTVATLASGATSYAASGLDPTQSYTYQVSASNSSGSATSGASSATQPEPAIPSSPTGLTGVIDGSGNMNLTWTAPTGATSYLVERETLATGIWSTLTTAATGTTYQDTGYGAGGYHYRVSATNASGTSSPSTEYPISCYAVIDLGNMSPYGLSNTGYVLLGGSNYQWYRWHGGVTDALNSSFIIPTGIDDQGTVVGIGDYWAAYVCLGLSTTATPLPYQPLGPNSADNLGDLWSVTSIDYNGKIYAIDQEGSGTYNILDGVVWNPTNGTSGETYPANETFLVPLVLTAVGVDSSGNTDYEQTSPYKEIDIAKNNHTLGVEYMDDSFNNMQYTVDGNPVNFVPIDINTAGLALGANYNSTTNSYTSYFCWDGTNTIPLPQPSGITYPIRAGGINAMTATITGTNGAPQTVPAAQVVGSTGGWGYGVGYIWNMVPSTSGPPTFGNPQALNDLVPANTPWSGIGVPDNGGATGITSGYNSNSNPINDSGCIIATATNSTDGLSHAIMLVVPAKFTLRDNTQINNGWDPDLDTDQIPWTIVAKAAVNGNYNDNELTKVVFATDQLASMFELAVADDSTNYIEINPGSPGQPVELTQKETNISIIGKNAGPIPNEIFNATIELRLKNDPNHTVVAKMMVKVVPDLAPLGLKFYAVTDSRFLLGTTNSLFGFSIDGTQIRSSLGNVGGMYSEAQSIFAQSALNFQLIGAVDARDVPYLKSPVGENNGPGGTTISNLDNEDASWMASHFQRSDFSDGNIACILVHQLDVGDLGFYAPESHLAFIPEDVWYPLYTIHGVQDYSWTENIVPENLPFLPEDGNGVVHSINRTYTHESGHYLLISTRGGNGQGSPIGGHDPGPFPPSTIALMHESDPGKWIRHEDWDRAATSAVQLLSGQTPAP